MTEVLSHLHRLAEDDDFFDTFVNSNPHLSDEPPSSTVASSHPRDNGADRDHLPTAMMYPSLYPTALAPSLSGGRMRSASEADLRSSVPTFLEGGASDIRRERERVAAMRSAAAAGLSPGIIALDDEELARTLLETQARLDEQQRSGVLAATVLHRVTQHLKVKDDEAHVDVETIAPTLSAVRNLLGVAMKSRQHAAHHAGLSDAAVKSLPPAPTQQPHSTVFGESLPHLADLCDDLTWLEWAIDRALPAVLTEEAELRAAAYLRYEDQHHTLKARLEEQSAVLREAQGALEGIASEVETLRLQRDELKTDLARVDADIASLSADTSTAVEADLIKALDAAQRSLEDARRKADAIALQRSEAERDRHDALMALHTEKELLATAELSMRGTSDLIGRTKAARAKGRQDLDNVERQIAVSDRDIGKARQAAAASEEELNKMQVKLADLRGQRDRLTAELKAATRSVDALKQETAEKVALRAAADTQREAIALEAQQLRSSRADMLQQQLEADEDLLQTRLQADAIESKIAYLTSLLPAHHPLKRQDPLP